MEIKDFKENEKLTICVTGSLDSVTSSDLEEFIRDNIEGINELILDFKELDYVSSAGLRVLLVTLKLMKTKGSIKNIRINPSLTKITKLSLKILPNCTVLDLGSISLE